MKATLIVAALLAAALTAASALPAAAAPNNGAFQQSSEAAVKQMCDTLHTYFQASYKNLREAKDKKSAAKLRDVVNSNLEDAVNLGCGWAQ